MVGIIEVWEMDAKISNTYILLRAIRKRTFSDLWHDTPLGPIMFEFKNHQTQSDNGQKLDRVQASDVHL
jgi:hypothetical protein